MSETLHCFARGEATSVVCLPFSLPEMLAEWSSLRTAMVREVAPEFTREEWADLATFVDPRHLAAVFERTFGVASDQPAALAEMLRPRGTVAVWLPNNVSLLGPLVLILLLLTGNRIRIKAGSRSDDLTTAFLGYLDRHLGAGTLRQRLREVSVESFGRESPGNAALALEADVRVVFGSDAAAAAIERLEHPLDSSGFAFRDRRSEAWLDRSNLDDDLVVDLIRVFAIYGRAGCTSPSRVLLLDASTEETIALRDRMTALWGRAVKRRVDAHVASQNILARQFAAAKGWNAATAASHGAVVAVGGLELAPLDFSMALSLSPVSAAAAVAALPPNVQTVGHNIEAERVRELLPTIARSPILRFVPLQRMHHFGPVWDGTAFWAQTFRRVEVGA